MKLRRGIHRQRHGNREYMSAAQTHFIEDALMLLFANKTIERRESTAGQQFKIAHGALGDLKRREPTSVRSELIQFLALDQQIYQGAAIRWDQERMFQSWFWDHVGILTLKLI